MQLLLSSTNLTAPTAETFEEYAKRRFDKLVRFLPNFSGEHQVKISIRRNRYIFEVVVELSTPGKLVVTSKDKDMRKAIDDAYATAKNNVIKRRRRLRERS